MAKTPGQLRAPNTTRNYPKASTPRYLFMYLIDTQKMEQLNDKDGLDCFPDSELDSESDEGEIYKYEHKYETLI